MITLFCNQEIVRSVFLLDCAWAMNCKFVFIQTLPLIAGIVVKLFICGIVSSLI